LRTDNSARDPSIFALFEDSIHVVRMHHLNIPSEREQKRDAIKDSGKVSRAGHLSIPSERDYRFRARGQVWPRARPNSTRERGALLEDDGQFSKVTELATEENGQLLQVQQSATEVIESRAAIRRPRTSGFEST